ncbi:MAG: hypothetical protein F4130_08260 [Acidobacteria bacterium]|nr:hypothetical protein [Gemmatimonadota bacterium]MYH22256.1 hypothetical protein [Acidobacteriota bacterium]
MKIRKVIMGAFAVAALTAATWGFLPFGVGAQDSPSGLLNFNDFVCPDECSIGAPVCCAILPPIIVNG